MLDPTPPWGQLSPSPKPATFLFTPLEELCLEKLDVRPDKVEVGAELRGDKLHAPFQPVLEIDR